jgi:hypothetical protein
MKKQAWPFLITRNKTFEYRAVIAPEFLSTHRQSSLLMEALEERITPDDQAFYREIANPDYKDMTVVFRVEMAREHHLGSDGDELLYDQQHRPIYFTEGLVFEGLGLDINVTEELFKDICQSMQEKYKFFWDSTDNPPATSPSDSMLVETGDDSEKYLQLCVLSPVKIASKLPAKPKQDKQDVSSPEQPNKINPLVVGASIAAAAAVATAGFLFIKNVR